MIKLTNLADYAVVLMCEISEKKERVSAQDLSVSTQLPMPTVSKILNALAHAGLLESKRGLKGGFTLQKNKSEISIANIIEAIDGPIALTVCTDNVSDDCTYNDICIMRNRWQIINNAVRTALNNVKLSDVSGTVDSRGLLEALYSGQARLTV